MLYLWRRLAARGETRAAVKHAAAPLVALLAGCAALQEGARDKSEWVYQGLHAVDFAQTVTIARRPQRYYEADPLTSRLIGRYPSERSVEAAWAGLSLAHLLVTGWLDREAEATGSDWWRAAKWVWQIASIGESAYCVHENFSEGLDLFGGRDGAPHATGTMAPRAGSAGIP